MSDLYDFMEVDPKKRMLMLAQALRQRQQEQDAEAMRLQGEFTGQQQKADQYRGLGLLTSFGSNPLLQGVQRASTAAGDDYQQDARTTMGLLRGTRQTSDPLRLLSIQAGMEKEWRLAEDAKTREARLAAEAAAREAERNRKAAAAAGAAEKKAEATAKKAAADVRKMEAGFRREILQSEQGKQYLESKTQYQMLENFAANPNPANSMAIVFAAMKSLDPTSVVKEGEQVQVRNTTNLPGQLVNYFNKVSTGDPLNAQQIAEIVDMGRRGFAARAKTLKEMSDAYKPLVEGAGGAMSNVMPLSLDVPDAGPLAKPTPQAAPSTAGRDFVRTFESEKGKFGQRKDGSIVRINPDGSLTPVNVKR